MKVEIIDIEKVLGFKINSAVRDRFNVLNFEYDLLTDEEMNNYLVEVVNVLTNDIVRSGEHRINDWEKGWGENLAKFILTKDINDLIPRYHSKNKYVRWNRQIVKPRDPNFDYNIHTIFVDSILLHYFNDVDDVFEFGCGPGYHLLRLKDYFVGKQLHGSDWTIASQDLIKEINNVLGTSINGFNLNFFTPDYTVNIPAKSGIYTVAALEQVGENYKEFINFLLEKKPGLCIHFEPIDELLDATQLIDNLSIRYFRKRNYLKGFLPYLEKLERQGKIEIIKKQRINTGSFFIEGHSLIIWRVL
jgi:hypothetical protein